ncbi:6557_t:CDS:2 [Diversispora eburnea]|uniref:6557_t:CDS:1 n=1 Tax=Diversispora eburnea TaxID=1213867 RepID=A0A9N9CT97_9GLOM|nr:6557_t:CDS:2 [Diversispora eburnea]
MVSVFAVVTIEVTVMVEVLVNVVVLVDEHGLVTVFTITVVAETVFEPGQFVGHTILVLQHVLMQTFLLAVTGYKNKSIEKTRVIATKKKGSFQHHH